MSATFDATTTAEYAAASTAAARSALIVAALTGTISVKVFDGTNTEMGSGTMDTPWATASGGTVTVGEVTSFTVGTTATPDSNWYIRFQNAGATRWVRGSFGLSSSGQDFTWSLSTWTATHTGTIGTATIQTAGNSAPAFTVAPTSASIAATGGTIQFEAVDPDNDAVVYSLTTTRFGITINDATTGLVTVTSAAAATSGNIVVQASDGTLTASATCAVTVAAPSTWPWPMQSDGPLWPHGTLNLYTGDGTNDGQLTAWRTWMGHQPDIMAVYIICNTWTQFRTALGNSTAYLYPVIASVPSTTPIILCHSMYPDQQPTQATGGYNNGGLDRYGGTKRLSGGDAWGVQQWNNFRYGYYDDHYRTMAQGLKNLCDGSHGIGSDGLRRSASSFILRLGWEMNGNWYAWSILNNVTAFKAAWERVVGIIREEIPDIWFDFSPSPSPVSGTSPAVYIENYTPNPNSWNVLSVSHHDAATVSGQSSSTVIRTSPSTWTPHETYLNRFLNHAKSLGKKMALTEWAAQMANCDTTYHVQSQDPEWFYIKTWEWLDAHKADIAWDTHFSPGCCSLVSRQTTAAAIYYKAHWA
jgi:hypothetical protein